MVVSTLVEIVRGRPALRRDMGLLKKITELESQLMVMEKITDQASNSEKDNYNMLAEDFRILRQNNQEKEQALNKFYQKIG